MSFSTLRKNFIDHGLSAISLMFFIFVAKLSGALKEVLLAKEYGISEQLDSFNFAINIGNVVFGMLFSVLSLTLGGLLQRPYAEVKPFIKELACACALIGAITGSIAWYLMQSNGNVDDSPAAIMLSVILVPTCIAAFLSAIATLRGRHVSSLLEGVPAAVLAAALLLSLHLDLVGLAALAMVGSITHCLLLINITREPKSDGTNQEMPTSQMWRAFGKSITVIILAQAALAAVILLDNYLLLHNKGGYLTEFNYAARIISIALSIFGLTITRFFIPFFLNEKNHSNVRKSIQFSSIVLVASALVTAASYQYMDHIVSLFYQNGSFGIEETERVVRTAKILVLQVPFYVSGLIFVAYYSANGGSALIAVTAMVAVITKLLIYAVCEWDVNPKLVAVSTAWMYFASYSAYLIYSVNLLGKDKKMI